MTTATEKEEPKARIVFADQIEECGARLRRGDLVAFPTETVYGLGCHALDPAAVKKVFLAKERPLTDPLIVHVVDPQDAYKLWEADSQTGVVVRALCETFWPGPLTLVAKAAPNVPSILMAGTGFVACRSPSHQLARRLIETSRVPLAAPSANKFGHVSPTKATHVWDDLKMEDVWILDQRGEQQDSCCQVGVESTVAKLEVMGEKGLTLTVLRQGAISTMDLEQCLLDRGLQQDSQTKVVVQSKTRRATSEHVANVAPGQTIRHYSPHISSFMVSHTMELPSSSVLQDALGETVVIDFGGRLAGFEKYCLQYRDLSPSNHAAEAAQGIFDTLRWAELVPGANRILFPELAAGEDAEALTLAVKDRLTRAASGEVINEI